MAQKVLYPDTGYTGGLLEAGGKNLKKCFQCGTCSVACPMTPDAHPFPRKEMVWASFGQKEKLMADVDLWLCHNCGNCSDLCPGGAQPAELMSACRDMVFQDIVLPGPVARWMSKPSGLVWLFAIPAIIWLIVWAIRAAIVGSWFPRSADGRIVYGTIFYGDYTIDPIFIITFFGALWIMCVGAKRLWRSFKPRGAVNILGRKESWPLALWHVLWDEVISASKFSDCEGGPATGVTQYDRRISHTAMVWSFCILTFVTTVVAIGHWGGKIIPMILIETPMPQGFWVKIVANIGAFMMLIALILLTWRRLALPPKYQSSSYYDWYLLGIIWVVALTGLFSQFFRLADWIHCAFITYYIHLVTVWMLFAWAPWSKLGHFIYRTTALVYVRMYGRNA